MLEYRLQKRREVSGFVGQFELGNPLPTDGIHYREIRLFVRSAKLEEQFQYLLFGARGVCRRLINFVDDDDWLEPQLQRLF